MKYRVEMFTSGGGYEGTLTVEAESEGSAASMAGLPTFAARHGVRRPYAHVTPAVKPGRICSRCGDRASACGGPANPHE